MSYSERATNGSSKSDHPAIPVAHKRDDGRQIRHCGDRSARGGFEGKAADFAHATDELTRLETADHVAVGLVDAGAEIGAIKEAGLEMAARRTGPNPGKSGSRVTVYGELRHPTGAERNRIHGWVHERGAGSFQAQLRGIAEQSQALDHSFGVAGRSRHCGRRFGGRIGHRTDWPKPVRHGERWAIRLDDKDVAELRLLATGGELCGDDGPTR